MSFISPISVFKRTSLFSSLLVLVGIWAPAQAAFAQALVPYVLPLDFERLEEQGLILAQEAAQLAQFQQYEAALARVQLAAQLIPDSAQVWGIIG